MKKIFFFLLFMAVIEGCSKNGNDPAFLGVRPGGCALTGKGTVAEDLLQKDTLTWTLTGDTLRIFTGFNATCCGKYNTTASVDESRINIEINTSQPGLCDCICYYTYTFDFLNLHGTIYYKVYSDGCLKFSGVIRLY